MKTQQPKNIIQRPSIESIIKGRGNTSTTILTNLHDIANALQVPDEYILKYLQFDLCAVSKLRNHQAYICGMHHVDLMEQAIEKFISQFVVCPKCSLPNQLEFIKQVPHYSTLVDQQHERVQEPILRKCLACKSTDLPIITPGMKMYKVMTTYDHPRMQVQLLQSHRRIGFMFDKLKAMVVQQVMEERKDVAHVTFCDLLVLQVGFE